MKIKVRVPNFVIEHPKATKAVLVTTASIAVLGIAYVHGAFRGVEIANRAMMEATIINPGMTVTDFLIKYGAISKK